MITIVDDDVPVLSISDRQVGEDDGVVILTVTADIAPAEDISIQFSTVDIGSASAGADYVDVVDGQAVLPAGGLSTKITIDILPDNVSDSFEVFNVSFSVASGDAVVDQTAATATVTIVEEELVALARLAPAIDLDGVVVVEIVLERFHELVTDKLITSTPTGVESFHATLSFDASDMQILEVREVLAFSGETSVEFDNSTVTIDAVLNSGTSTITELPAVMVKLVVRLDGSAQLSTMLTLDAFEIMKVFNPNVIGQGTAPSIEFRRGDTQADGEVGIFDALYLAQCLAGQREIGAGEDECALVNAASVRQDGEGGDRVSIKDALFIAQYLVGIRDKFFE